jgi:hypothetical protein
MLSQQTEWVEGLSSSAPSWQLVVAFLAGGGAVLTLLFKLRQQGGGGWSLRPKRRRSQDDDEPSSYKPVPRDSPLRRSRNRIIIENSFPPPVMSAESVRRGAHEEKAPDTVRPPAKGSGPPKA